ncbi:choice-of-anchor I family protein [Chitinophaga sp. sic0106]|uniref:choice-of-anchor I family protein n=1 Tax=Chitinophaga sp. sic0106 TaxID=2854785 RepID=UPI001C44977A|nr:choice-of-anchor I family protein [Chitinophaga sp. sic0106]MBV7531173.1 choice-of-anchor I family protein [Chitinophaga sp. sic0106]
MNYKKILPVLTVIVALSCKKDHPEEFYVPEDPATFSEIGSIDIGNEGAAEISAFDPKTNHLFVVYNAEDDNGVFLNRIDVIDLKDPAKPVKLTEIAASSYGGYVNSLSVNNGLLAAAIESTVKQEPGKVVIFKTSDNSLVKSITVGALPDMLTFSPDGRYILSANEGEPNAAYTNDPVGSISIIDVQNNYEVKTIDFSGFESQKATLMQQGLRVFGPKATLAQDMEPEYIAVADDSKTAWVTLQENNVIATIDIAAKTIKAIKPLGLKDYNVDANAVDVSDKDNVTDFKKWNVKSMYQPDGIAVLHKNGVPYLFTANEGDVREYDGFEEAKRVSALKLNPAAFPDAATLQGQTMLGRLNVTTTLGDTDGDGLYEQLYSFGARSFSVWDGNSGTLVFDSKNELEVRAKAASLYDDARSDDKGVEPEGLTLGEAGKKKLLFVGMERAMQ